jgi:hypothetical protein
MNPWGSTHVDMYQFDDVFMFFVFVAYDLDLVVNMISLYASWRAGHEWFHAGRPSFRCRHHLRPKNRPQSNDDNG